MKQVEQAGSADTDLAVPHLGMRRSAERIKTIYRLVKIEHGDDEGFARCRNISDGGAQLDAYMPLELNDQVTVAFSPTAVLAGHVVWVNGRYIGIAFDEPINCAQLLSDTTSEGGKPNRLPRLNASVPARVTFQGGACEAMVRDISVHGMKIANDRNFQPGLKVRIVIGGTCEKEAVVRWSQNNIAGVMLLDPFGIEELGSLRRLTSTG